MECTRKAYFSCGADTAKKIHQTAVERMKAWFPQGCMEVQVLPEFTFFPTIWHYNKIIRYTIAIWKLIPVVIGNFPIVTIAVTSCNMVQLFSNSNHFLTMHSVG